MRNWNDWSDELNGKMGIFESVLGLCRYFYMTLAALEAVYVLVKLILILRLCFIAKVTPGVKFDMIAAGDAA